MPEPFQTSGAALWQWRSEALRQITQWGLTPSDRVQLQRELDWLIASVSSLDRLALRLGTYQTATAVSFHQGRSLDHLSELWQQRLQQRVPLQYLLGEVTWRDLTLTVAPGVLIPRPETEGLIDLVCGAIAHPPQAETGHWVDLGTGSGAIALALARLLPQATIHAVDCSAAALVIARHNAAQLGLTERIHFYEGTWLHPLADLKGQLAGIISNPPYIPTALIPTLQPEVAHHEPHLALDGGADGLTALQTILEAAPAYLRSGGLLFLEMMMGQADMIDDRLHRQGNYTDIQMHPDGAGILRFSQARRI